MSYNGSGTFVINTAGQPVVSGTVISSTAFNALTADLATGLSTAITKDGQTTPTANIPMGNNKITGLAVGTAATDAANLSQVQSTTAKLVNSVSGADTITGTMSPTLGAYATGQMFYFIAAGDNTGAVTLNIDSLGAKAVTRDGTTALAAGDIQSGEVCVVVYDGTRFQLVNGASQSASIVTENLTVNKATVLNESGGDNDTRIEGDTDANLVFVDASTDRVGFGTSTPSGKVNIVNTASAFGLVVETADNPISGARYAANADGAVLFLNKSRNATVGSHTIVQSGDELGAIFARGSNGTSFVPAASISFAVDGTPGSSTDMPGRIVFSTSPDGAATAEERLRITAAGNVGIGTSSPTAKLHVWQTGAATSLNIDGTENPIFASRYAANADGATVFLAKSRNATVGSQTIVQSGDELGVIKARGSNGTSFVDAAAITFAVDGTPGAGSDMPGRIVFGTSADGTASITERARIQSGGAFLVGTTSGAYTGAGCINSEVSTSGDFCFAGVNTNATNPRGLYLRNPNTTAGDYAIYLEASSATKFYVNGNGVIYSTNTSVQSVSDARHKENVRDLDKGLAEVLALKPRRFDWKEGKGTGAKNVAGFIAQEVETVLPELVGEWKETVDAEETFKSIGMANVIPMLVKAIQELKAELDAAKVKIAALEAK